MFVIFQLNIEGMKLMPLPLVLSPKQRKIRYQWLILTIIKFIALPDFFGIFDSTAKLQLHFSIGSLIGTLIGGGLVFYILYVCAYKNYGNRFLTYCMLIGVVSLYSVIKKVFDYDHNALDIGILFACISFEVWWFILSLKMRTLNQDIKFYSSSDAISSTTQGGS